MTPVPGSSVRFNHAEGEKERRREVDDYSGNACKLQFARLVAALIVVCGRDSSVPWASIYIAGHEREEFRERGRTIVFIVGRFIFAQPHMEIPRCSSSSSLLFIRYSAVTYAISERGLKRAGIDSLRLHSALMTYFCSNHYAIYVTVSLIIYYETSQFFN